MEISDDNGMFQKCFVFNKKLDENIDSTIISTYAYDLGSLHKQCDSNFDKDFVNALSSRGEISNMSASIGIFNVSSEDCDLFQSPSVTNITNI